MAFSVTPPAHISPLDYLLEAPNMLEVCLWVIEAHECPGGINDPDTHDLHTAYDKAKQVLSRLEMRRR